MHTAFSEAGAAPNTEVATIGSSVVGGVKPYAGRGGWLNRGAVAAAARRSRRGSEAQSPRQRGAVAAALPGQAHEVVCLASLGAPLFFKQPGYTYV
jgi:hypothetical protein